MEEDRSEAIFIPGWPRISPNEINRTNFLPSPVTDPCERFAQIPVRLLGDFRVTADALTIRSDLCQPAHRRDAL